MLICTNCGREYPLEEHAQRCALCNEPLEVERQRGKINEGSSTWLRFRDFYSYMEFDMSLSMGEGDTPLVKCENLGENVYLKNEGINPTWSFKDRGTFVALNRAISLGFKKIGVVSTGNMAASVAAYAARAGLKAYVFVPSSTSSEKIAQISAYAPKIILVDGDYGELYYRSLKIGRKLDIYFINSDEPFRVEGYKGIAFEIGEKMEADYVVVPTSSGGLLRGIMKGFVEMKESGLIDKLPIPVAVQAAGCSPICNSFLAGMDSIERTSNPDTIAHAIANPYPPSGNAVLKLLRTYGGRCIKVSDEAILSARKKLASEGVFVQPASATAAAALEFLKLRNERVVLILTGSGLKVKMEYYGDIHPCKLDRIERCVEEIR